MAKLTEKQTNVPKQQEREVRIKFSASFYISGKSMKEIREKWENCPLFSADALQDFSPEFDERLLVEDANTYEDVSKEFDRYQHLQYEL